MSVVLTQGARIESDIDPFGDEFLTNPYPGHKELRDAGPVVWLRRYGVWAVARHAQVESTMRDYDTFCSSRGVGLIDFATEQSWRTPSLLLESDPPEHTTARRVMTSVITPRAVKARKAVFRRVAEVIVDGLLERGNIDGVHDLGEAFPLKVMPDWIGLPQDGRENLLAYASMVFNAQGPRNARVEMALERATPGMPWIAACTERENLAPGGLGIQIHESAAAEGVPEQEAQLLVRSLMSAGIDTGVHAIGNALLCFSQNPDQWSLLCARPDLARVAFEEVLRFEAPAQVAFRTATRNVTVEGVEISEGHKVMVFMASANRDPRRWEHPDRFDITRAPTGNSAFGAGIHSCVGQMVARLEGEVVLEVLAHRIAQIVPNGEPQRQLNHLLRGLDSLPLVLKAR